MSSENNYSLYVHTCLVGEGTGRKYYGITKRRPSQRWGKNGAHYRACPHFYSAIQKYGWENFSHEVLADGLTKEEASELERFYIGFDGSADTGFNIQYGGISAGGMSEEGKQSLRDHNTGENANNKRSVVVFDLSGKRINEFPVAIFAADYYGIKHSTLNSHLRKRGTCHGMMFRYKDEIGDCMQLPKSEIYRVNEHKALQGKPKKPLRAVVSFDCITGERMDSFSSIQEARAKTGADVQAVLNGRQCTSKGLVFKYAEDCVGKNALDKEETFNPLEASYRGKSVNQYDLDGNYLKTYKSLLEASEHISASSRAISLCIRKGNSSGGYQWRYDNGDRSNIGAVAKRKEKKGNKVFQIDAATGKTICEFSSLHLAARETGLSRETIRGGIKRGLPTHKGKYLWKTSND